MALATMRVPPPPTKAPSEDAPAPLALQTAALRPLVRAVVATLLGEGRDHPDVEDCTHEALRRALEGYGRLRDGEALRPWLVGIARHVALDKMRERKRVRRRAAGGEGQEGGELEATVERFGDPGPGPDEQALHAERRRLVQQALEGLNESQRSALLLVHLEGLSYQEVAARLGVPLGTVATWIARGRRSVADHLREHEALP
jgi:RNA polymerase sigma-70 factor, ECF subfamily